MKRRSDEVMKKKVRKKEKSKASIGLKNKFHLGGVEKGIRGHLVYEIPAEI